MGYTKLPLRVFDSVNLGKSNDFQIIKVEKSQVVLLKSQKELPGGPGLRLCASTEKASDQSLVRNSLFMAVAKTNKKENQSIN